jgi:hypothetical protein
MHGSFYPPCLQYAGETWRQAKDKYYRNKFNELLHRRVYQDHFGPIPLGYVVHHKDHDRGNNSPDNLELMTRSEHTRHHQKGCIPHPNQLAASSAEMTKRWENAPTHRIICVNCDEPFETRSLQPPRQFCSDKCQDAWRVVRFVPEMRRCDRCGKGYTASRRAQRYCSEICNQRAAQHRSRKQPSATRTVICACCGQAFMSKRSNARFCGRECAVRFHGLAQRRRKVSDARGRG